MEEFRSSLGPLPGLIEIPLCESEAPGDAIRSCRQKQIARRFEDLPRRLHQRMGLCDLALAHEGSCTREVGLSAEHRVSESLA